MGSDWKGEEERKELWEWRRRSPGAIVGLLPAPFPPFALSIQIIMNVWCAGVWFYVWAWKFAEILLAASYYRTSIPTPLISNLVLNDRVWLLVLKEANRTYFFYVLTYACWCSQTLKEKVVSEKEEMWFPFCQLCLLPITIILALCYYHSLNLQTENCVKGAGVGLLSGSDVRQFR